jgi:hypothetical protein
MDLSWVAALTPLQIAEVIAGVMLLILLARYTGLTITKKGVFFKASQKNDAIFEAVKAIKESDGRQEQELKRLGERVNNNTKDTLRLTFYNPLLSPANRLVAGKRYLAAGGNGDTGKDIHEFAAQHPDVWQGIMAVKETS